MPAKASGEEKVRVASQRKENGNTPQLSVIRFVIPKRF